MELINHTIAQAQLYVSEASEEWRTGFIVAKLTFAVSPNGGLAPVVDDPIPIVDMDAETELGVMPCDLVTRMDSGVDVMLLGAAYAPGGRPVEEMTVTMRVGDVARQLKVTGDRHWIGQGSDARPSPPAPFARMPLTWDRAFGGGADVWVDAHTTVPLNHQGNPPGKGFDLEKHAAHVGRGFGSPEGFPRLDYVRELPNVEHPAYVVTRWEDDPEPYCWGAISPQLATYRLAKQYMDAEGRIQPPEAVTQTIGHPDWRLPPLSPGMPVVLEGCSPHGTWWFQWPSVRVAFDYELGPKRGTRTLDPFMLTLLPDESRVAMTFRAFFKFRKAEERADRSIRLRLES